MIASAKTADDFVKLSLASEVSEVEWGILYNNFIQQIKDLDLETLVGDKSAHHLRKVEDEVKTIL